MSLLSFSNVSLNLAGKQLLDKADLQIQPNERIALVGRNGAGKSTLLKLLLGEMTEDSGVIQKQSNLKVAGLTQEVPIQEQQTVYHFLVQELGEKGKVLSQFYELSKKGDSEALIQCQHKMDELHAWDVLPVVDAMATRLEIDKDADMTSLSGGMKRRALLASALISEPDLLILDEPTNHLDILAIEWLEAYLKQYNGSVLLVTHDRTFLSQVADRIIEIDRGKLNPFDCSYETYLDRKEAMRLTEQKQAALFEKQLNQEEAWLRQGIKARRTRNEGRVRALKKMRETYKNRREELGKMSSVKVDATQSGKLVLDAEHINYAIGGKSLIQKFSLRVMRGAKIGIVGPNGCGKTTLVRLLLKEIQPDSGTVRHGTSLDVAYFDQLRRSLQENETVMKNVADGADFVTVNGQQKHVASYLKEFLFAPESFNRPASTLSGGERNRLMLAKLFTKPVNLLVMDEPTNDLDIETLELLESILIDYQGTLLLISHDRAFINNVVTSVMIYEGDGQFNEYIGGYEDYQRQASKSPELKKAPEQKPQKQRKLSYNEQRELSALPEKIEALEEKISHLQDLMADPEFYQQNNDEIIKYNQELADAESKLAEFYERWEALEDK